MDTKQQKKDEVKPVAADKKPEPEEDLVSSISPTNSVSSQRKT